MAQRSTSQRSSTIPFTGTSRTVAQTSQQQRGWIERILSKHKDPRNTKDLEEVIDLDRDYNNFTTQDLATVNPRKLYEVGLFRNKSGLYKKQREDILQVGEGDVTEIDLLSKKAFQQLSQQGYEMAHIGLIIIGIKPLHRGGMAKRTIITVADTGFDAPEDQLIACIEADMNQKAGIFYCAPNTTNTLKTIQKHFKIGVMTNGYGNISHENLAITVAVLGRLSASTSTNYKLNINAIIEAASTQGVAMLPAEPADPMMWTNRAWDLSKILRKKQPAVLPKKHSILKRADGSLSLRFHEYENTRGQEDSDEDDS